MTKRKELRLFSRLELVEKLSFEEHTRKPTTVKLTEMDKFILKSEFGSVQNGVESWLDNLKREIVNRKK